MRYSSVLALCDDLFVQGHQLAGWIIDYVDLEESLAVGSISQEMLAHSAALMGVCGIGPADRDVRIFRRPADQWYPSRVSCLPERDWPATVIRGLLLNRAMLAIRPLLVMPDRPRVKQLADVIHAEEDLHASHWTRWVGILARDVTTVVELQQRTDEALADAADLFGPAAALNDDEDADSLLGASELAAAHATWVDDVTALLEEHGLDASSVPVASVARRAAAPCLEDMLIELTYAREPDGSSNYEVYQ